VIEGLIGTVENLELGERTRAIYTSDHREMLGGHGPGVKLIMYEGPEGDRDKPWEGYAAATNCS
jgi:hypothetical protein